MKFILPVVCSLLLIGCTDSAQTKKGAPTAAETPISAEADSTAAEANATPAKPQSATTAPETAEPKTEGAKAPETKPAPVAQDAPPEPAKNEKPVAAPSGADGAALYAQKCASCHGQKGEKAALGKSQHIGGWSTQQAKDALHGYQTGSYGKEMKAVMAAQAKSLSNDQIDAVAQYISTL